MKVELDPLVDQQTFLAGPIKAYLESQEKRIDQAALTESQARLRHILIKDLMQPRETRAGKESCTLYTGLCPRKSRLILDGAEREPIRSRTVLKFMLGDLVEMSVLTLARLAGCAITDNNIDLSIRGEDGSEVPVHPDGYYQHGTDEFNVEIKSCDSHTFDWWLRNNGPDDTWGYLTQASVEVQAWREAGRNVRETLFVAVSTGSRQGDIAEWVVPYDEQLVIGWHERRRMARQLQIPEIPFEAQPEMEFVRGKHIKAEWMEHGEPTPRKKEDGTIYGWDVITGRRLVPLVCTYCDFRAKHCWQNAVMELDGTKPRWIVPESVKA